MVLHTSLQNLMSTGTGGGICAAQIDTIQCLHSLIASTNSLNQRLCSMRAPQAPI